VAGTEQPAAAAVSAPGQEWVNSASLMSTHLLISSPFSACTAVCSLFIASHFAGTRNVSTNKHCLGDCC
jgi:hypothetical protein